MPDKSHAVIFADSPLLTTSNKRNTSAMKTNMRQSDSPEETPKGLRWPDAGRHFKRPLTSLSFHLLEHGDESGAEGEHSSFSLMPLDSEMNGSPVEINIAQGQASFAKATALLPSDDVAQAHPFRLVLKSLHDLRVFIVRDSRLARRCVLLNAKLSAGIDRCVAALDGLVHDKTEKLALLQCGVLGCLVAAGVWLTVLPPVNESADVLTCKLARNVDAIDLEIGRNVPPASDVAVQRPKPIVIPLPQEPLDPRVPRTVVVRAGRSLSRSHFTAKSVRLTAFRYNGVSKFCRFLASLPANVAVFEPKKRTPVPLVKSGHVVKENLVKVRRKHRRQRV